MDSKKILVIDDDTKDRDLVSSRLNEAGYNVICAVTGDEALKRLKDEKFDLVILDLILPDIKGEELYQQIRKINRYKRLPVVVLSAKDDAEEIEELFEKGVDDYIIKPPRLSYLVSRVDFNVTDKSVNK